MISLSVRSRRFPSFFLISKKFSNHHLELNGHRKWNCPNHHHASVNSSLLLLSCYSNINTELSAAAIIHWLSGSPETTIKYRISIFETKLVYLRLLPSAAFYKFELRQESRNPLSNALSSAEENWEMSQLS